ncbi:MAG TPA: nucleotidyltransferase family protein [Terriglobia bacterium]|nr:nucleotidyltransferase family protein [Terriglobia bacterium]
MRTKSVAGIILAAGKSERMGSSKSLLRIGNKTFLEHIDLQARLGGLNPTWIVLGHEARKIRKALPQLASRTIINPDYEQGQLSSLLRGLKELEGTSIEGVMLLLVDHPFVTEKLIRRLVRAFSRGTHALVIPTFRGRRGHPVIFGRPLFSELMHAPLHLGAAEVVKANTDEILHMEVEDEGILIDIDTPEIYRQNTRKLAHPDWTV